MEKYLKKLPLELKKIINLARDVSSATKMPAYLVGGFVRDLLLGVDNFDLDITVEGSGIIFAQKLAKKLKAKILIHERFGTATLTFGNCLKVDVATTRKEKYPSPACLPEVTLGSLAEDLLRRDFTINAMAINISRNKNQELIDPFGGKNDLENRKIRFLHNSSFQDDPTRILRAIRFEQRFNFRIEPQTLALLKQAIQDDLLNKVHAHRMRDDLILMLKEKNPVKPIKRLADLNGLAFLSEELKFNQATQKLFKAAESQILWFTKNYASRRQLDLWLIYFTLLLMSLNLAALKAIALKLGLRKGETKRLINYHQESQKIISSLSKSRVAPEYIFSLLEPISYEELVILRVVCQNKNLWKYITDFLEIYNGMKLCVKGHDLHGLGLLPGPRYQKIFAQVLTAKLNGLVKSRAQELALIKKLI